ncbi:hypothetical protein ACMFMG_001420 [Clarireedia jacksonii]
MQFQTAVLVAFAGVFAPAVLADNCMETFVYCGSHLLNVGKYSDTIKQALVSANFAPDKDHVDNTLFVCALDGWLKSPFYCSKGCAVAGDGAQAADHCN